MAEEDMPEEEDYDDGDEGYYDEDEEDLDTVDQGALQEAFSAGSTAKQRTAQQRKGRGYKGESKSKGKGKGKGKRPPDTRTPDARKKNSTCASCGQRGRWKGDEVCPNVRSGKDALHQKRENEAHFNTGTHQGRRHPAAGPARPVKQEPAPERGPLRRRPQPLPDRRRPAQPAYPPPRREPAGTKRRRDDGDGLRIPEPGTKGLSTKVKARRRTGRGRRPGCRHPSRSGCKDNEVTATIAVAEIQASKTDLA